MGLNLTVDQGNTKTKLALWNAGGESVWTCERLHPDARELAGILGAREIDTAIYCSVRRERRVILHALNKMASRVIEFNPATPTPLRIDYATPDTLGADRLAAAVGAYLLPGNSGKEILVVDLGTAITYDRVSADGAYKGGNIAPGVSMRLNALHKSTAKLPAVNRGRLTGASVPLWGNDTVSALTAGAVRGVVAEIEYYHRKCSEATVVLTGGDAVVVEPLLSFGAHLVPDLVSKGLNDIIEYNK